MGAKRDCENDVSEIAFSQPYGLGKMQRPCSEVSTSLILVKCLIPSSERSFGFPCLYHDDGKQGAIGDSARSEVSGEEHEALATSMNPATVA